MSPTLLNIHITLDEQEEISLGFSPEKYNWDNLVDAIISNSSTCIELPILLYYRNGLGIKSVENSEQFSKLVKVTEFYSRIELVKETAFVRLGKLVEKHKQAIASSTHISRCIGIMASAIALDTNNKAFENEFTALEKLILSGQEDTPIAQHNNRGRHGHRHGNCSKDIHDLGTQLSNTHIDKREFKRRHGGPYHF